MKYLTLVILSLIASSSSAVEHSAPSRPFAIIVVDEATGRGVPLVELRTVNEVVFYSDSAGVAAIDEPGFEGETVFFHVKSHGYEFPADGFGYRGKALKVVPGETATLKLKRINIAERLYRITGAGIYRDSVVVGRKPPIEHPLLNAKVLGSDSVLNAVCQSKLWWFWGDTNRPSYPLGNFHTPGATSDLPEQGGLDPEIGVNLHYLSDANGFAAETAKFPGEGPTWLSGLAAFRDEKGQEHLVAGYAKIRPPMEIYEHGLAEFDFARNRFEKVVAFPNDSALRIGGHPFLSVENGQTYINYADPFPNIRVKADLESLRTIERYEGYSCLTADGKVDRDADGKPRFQWRPNTPVLTQEIQAKLIRDGRFKESENPLRLLDIETGKPVFAHRGSLNWNAHRKRWVMIAVQQFGTSMLGEIWYAEADRPLGPWAFARKIVTHDTYSFYNPKQHPYFDKDNGATIFFEGTYTKSFSGQTNPTPRYDYNQVLYKLRLDDPRLNLPVAVYRSADGSHHLGDNGKEEAVAFFAMEKPSAGTVPIVEIKQADGSFAFEKGEKALFHAVTEAPMTEALSDQQGKPIGRVWKTP